MSDSNNRSIQREDIKVIQTFVDTMVGIPKFSYPARQNNAPKPADEFAHIRLLEEYPVGIPTQEIVSQDDDTTTYRTYSPAKLRFRIGVVDTTGIAASKIMHGWTTESVREIMMSTGYGFILVEPLSDESTKLEKEWEIRQGFALEVYVTRTFEETVNNITALSVSGTAIFCFDEYLLNFDINN